MKSFEEEFRNCGGGYSPGKRGAHFGLLFSRFALLEAALHNLVLYVRLQQELHSGSIRSTGTLHNRAEAIEREAFAMTFGSLLQALHRAGALSEFFPRLNALKKKRDYFAHHFFREKRATIRS